MVTLFYPCTDHATKIKSRPAPEKIEDGDATEAFALIESYRSSAVRALASAHRYGGGTRSSQKQHERYVLYTEAADSWAKVFREWIERKVQGN
jgi:hypothetical protein